MSTLARYRSPFDVFAKLSNEMNDWFGRDLPTRPFFAGFPAAPEGLYAPLAIEESEAEYVVRLDIPGIAEKDIKIACTAEQLQISGEKKEEKSETKGNTHYSERQYGAFNRIVSLPAGVKSEAVRARYKDGVLEVHLPKAQKTPTKEIKIERT